MDYLTGGMEMAFVVAIDFTASNLNPANPKSLHYNHGTVENSHLPFSIIIVGVGGANFDAMEELDSDDELLE